LHRSILVHCLKDNIQHEIIPHILLKSMIGPLYYLIGAAFAWESVHLAFYFYIITPLYSIIPPARRGERHG
jgi:hypothetical protein